MAIREKQLLALAGFALAGSVAWHLVLGTVLLPKLGADVSLADAYFHAIPMCGDGSNVSETFDSEMRRVSTRMHAGMSAARSGNADHDFAAMMIAHHQGAIEMARVQLKYGNNEQLKRLAQSIIVEQGQEIAYMRTLGNKQTTSRNYAADH